MTARRGNENAPAIRIGPRTAAVIVLSALVGLFTFCWPFVLRPGSVRSSDLAPMLFGLLLLLVVAVLVAEISEGGIDSKALAMLGVLSAIDAALRPLGAGTAGIEPVFFLLILAGRVFGPGFGFTLGCTSLFASGFITGGIGPSLPYQMFGCAFVGLFAGLLPRCRGRLEILLLAAYGAVAGVGFGFLLNLSFWPFSVDRGSGTSYLPGASTATNIQRYLAFDGATSFGWDTGRALTNIIAILVVGPTVLAALRRAARKAAFEAPVTFAPGANTVPSRRRCDTQVS